MKEERKMSNEILFIASVLIYLGSVVLLYKLFGKNGLFAFAIFGTLLGNIAVCKCIDLFGLSATSGNVLYASTFLVTDILSERYGKKAGRPRLIKTHNTFPPLHSMACKGGNSFVR